MRSSISILLLALTTIHLTGCGPQVDPNAKPVSTTDLPRTPRHNYSVPLYQEKGPYLYLEDEFVNDTLCNFFEVRTRPNQGDSLIYRSRYFSNRPANQKSRLFVTKENRIWWYVESKGTFYWEQRDGKWQEYRYEKPWEGIPKAPEYLANYAPKAHPH